MFSGSLLITPNDTDVLPPFSSITNCAVSVHDKYPSDSENDCGM